MRKREPKGTPADEAPLLSVEPSVEKKAVGEEVEVHSRVDRPLVFKVRGGDAVRLAAFEMVKLPGVALEAPELQRLLAEGAITVITPQKPSGRRRREDEA